MISPGFEQTLDRCPGCGSTPVVAETSDGVRINCRNCGEMDVDSETETMAMVEWNRLCRRE